MPLQFGIDIILQNEPNWKKERIGMLTNDAAKTNHGKLSRLALIEAGFNLTQLFSPEHGMKAIGEDGAPMQNGIDEITGLSIISLYGTKFMPSAEDLKEIDILLFDVPDAGTRFYTYLWSMTYWIEAATKYNKKVIILDRPNPIGGDLMMAEGPMLDDSISSFIGRFNIPIKHQCTLGELAIYFNDQQNWNANLSIIKCVGWQREALFYNWGIKWEKPSPALQNMEATLLYPGLCFFEATNVSVGRGTPHSFEWIGAEWFNLPAITKLSQNIFGGDLYMEVMKLPILKNENSIEITGLRLKIRNSNKYDAVLNGLLLLKIIKDIHPKDFKWMPYPTQANPTGKNHLDLLLGVPNGEALFDLPLKSWLQQITKLTRVSEWYDRMVSYLLYP
jgi:uncharacterized protein YbbC (DUF1343 family)